MYIRSLIPSNFTELAEAVPIGLVTVYVLLLFLMMPLVGLQCVIVVLQYHTHLLFFCFTEAGPEN